MPLLIASHPYLVVLFWAGTITGLIDLAAALTFSAARGVMPKRVFQAIASAMMGPMAFEQDRAAVLGCVLHFVIAFIVAAVYVDASRYFHLLNEHPVVSGMLYGIGVHLVMTFLVLPLSALKRPFSMSFFWGQLVIHAFCVGLPIALVTRHFAQLD